MKVHNTCTEFMHWKLNTFILLLLTMFLNLVDNWWLQGIIILNLDGNDICHKIAQSFIFVVSNLKYILKHVYGTIIAF